MLLSAIERVCLPRMKRNSKIKNINCDQSCGASEFRELPCADTIAGDGGDQLTNQPPATLSLLELLDTWEPLDEEFPEIEDLPPRPIDF